MAFLGDQIPPHSVIPVHFTGPSDPSLSVSNHVGPGKMWLKSNSAASPSWFELYIRNADNDAWIQTWTRGAIGVYSEGDILYTDSNGRMIALNVGTVGQVLTSDGDVPTWDDPVAGVTGSGTNTKLTKWTSGTAVGDSSVTENSTDLTSTKPLYVPASSTSVPSLRVPHGSAPTSPTNGDIWTTTAGLFARINGSTVGPFSTGSGTVTGSGTTGTVPKWSGSTALGDSDIVEGASTITITKPLILPAASSSIPSVRAPHGSAPSSPTDGDVWTTTAGIYVRINGATVGPLIASGASVLLATVTANNTATTMDFTGFFSATYDEYEIRWGDFVPATDNISVHVRVRRSGQGSFDSTASDYRYAHQSHRTGNNTFAGTVSTTATEINIGGAAGNSTGEGLGGIIRFFNPLQATLYKNFLFDTYGYDSTPEAHWWHGMGVRVTATALDGVQLVSSSGNITSGWARLYGVTK